MSSLEHQKVLVTAGPTYEPIDPVRFIGNRSSGKMGLAIVDMLLEKNADVILIIGPTALKLPAHPNLKIIEIETAEEMFRHTLEYFPSVDIGIFAAAVADYTPKTIASSKIKKSGDSLVLELVKTKDILKEMGLIKKPNQITIGFALETDHEIEHAKDKIIKKNLDAIVLNSLNDKGAGFKYDTNKIKIIDRDFKITNFELKGKNEVAIDITKYLEQLIQK